MNSKNANQKREELAKILQPLWDSYQHMYSVRKSNIQNSINFLLIVVSFLPIVCITFSTYFKNELFLVPIVFQFAALLILLKSFFIKGQKIPWLEFNETLDAIDKGSFKELWFATLKAAENDTHVEMRTMNKIIRIALSLLIFSIYGIALIMLIVKLENTILLYPSSVLLTLIFMSLIYFYRKQPSFAFDQDYEKYLKKVAEWSSK
jgi:hypothetical protein